MHLSREISLASMLGCMSGRRPVVWFCLPQAGGARPNGEHWPVRLQATQAAPSASASSVAAEALAAVLMSLARRCAPWALALGAVTQCHASPARHAAASRASARLRVLADLWRAARHGQLIGQQPESTGSAPSQNIPDSAGLPCSPTSVLCSLTRRNCSVPRPAFAARCCRTEQLQTGLNLHP